MLNLNNVESGEILSMPHFTRNNIIIKIAVSFIGLKSICYKVVILQVVIVSNFRHNFSCPKRYLRIVLNAIQLAIPINSYR